jgi:hemoglobin-like flavoprotein
MADQPQYFAMAISAPHRAPTAHRKEMPMTPDQITLVKASFDRLAPQADAVAAAFYARLFQIAPGLRAMFPADLGPQRAKLMQMLAAAVRGLDDVSALMPAVAALGQRHAGYGVQPGHYATVGQALLDTLQSGLGADFTPALRQAWSAVYGALSDAMQAGAPHAAAAPSQPALAA